MARLARAVRIDTITGREGAYLKFKLLSNMNAFRCGGNAMMTCLSGTGRYSGPKTSARAGMPSRASHRAKS